MSRLARRPSPRYQAATEYACWLALCCVVHGCSCSSILLGQVHKARLRLHKPPPRRWWSRQNLQQQAEFYSSLPRAAVAATQARLAEGVAADGTVAVKVRHLSNVCSPEVLMCHDSRS